MNSKVYLVGAGPGDPGLLTLKACRALEEADLVIYDYLSNTEHLNHCKSTVQKVAVGKGFRHKAISQQKINRLIVSAAQKNQTVVRLKGGDPYLFGRGGEEALFLHEHKIPFEVVPGVTSATACAAYAGIPLTHRDHNQSVTFLTGHRAEDGHLDTLPWKKIVEMGGTLAIYMGFYNLKSIAENLIKNGMNTDMPVAVVEWGTLPTQKSVVGALKNIGTLVEKKNLKPPAMIFIGEVVGLSAKLNWYERLPLFGKKIVITRTKERAGAMTEKLRNLGAEVVEFPVIEIGKPKSFTGLDGALREIQKFDWVVFSSTYGVESFFERLAAQKKDARALSGIKFACVGPGTAMALKSFGVSTDLLPDHYETSAIVEKFRTAKINLKEKRVLLPRTDIAPPALQVGLKKLGALVTQVTAYTTRTPKIISAEFKKEILTNGADFVTFTSSSTVDNFVKIMGLREVKRLSKKAKLASIGPVTSEAMRRYGLKPAVEAKIFTVEGLVNAIKNCHSRKF